MGDPEVAAGAPIQLPEAPGMRPPRMRFAARRTVVAVAAAALLSGCPNGHDRPDGHTDVTFDVSPGGGEVVFNADGAGGRDLYRLDLASLRVTRIAATPDYEVDPEYSPDGTSVVYAAGKPGDRADHVFLRSLDGLTVRQLTAGGFNDSAPTFSPDGRLIAFARDKTYRWGGLASNWSGGEVLCVMKADGTGLRQLTGDGLGASDPHFLPDGATIVFAGPRGWSAIPADGSGPPTPLPGLRGSGLVHSRDGGSVAFSDGRYAPDCRIFVGRADGTGIRKLDLGGGDAPRSPGGGCFKPAFTPDGKRILFFLESWPGGPSGSPRESLWAVDPRTGDSREIADFSLFDDPLRWRGVPPTPARGRGR